MQILAGRLRCWHALNRAFLTTTRLFQSSPRTPNFVMDKSELNPSPNKRTLDELLGQSSKRPRLSGGPPNNNENVKRGDESDAGLQESSGDQAQKGKSKEKKRSGRRRRARQEVEREPQLDEEGNEIPKAPRYPKRQCALLLGFCGSGYSGMQMCGMGYLTILRRNLTFLVDSQKDVKTIEGVLFNALVKIGAVSQDNADDPTKVNVLLTHFLSLSNAHCVPG
jgi:tRNA pseudouridine38-40 synthase